MNTEIQQHLSQDQILEKIIQVIELPPIQSTQNVFQDLMSCIIEQQIHYRSTKNIFIRRLERAGLEALTLDNFHVFEEKGIKDTKLSGRKLETIQNTLDFFAAKSFDWWNMQEEEVLNALSQIKGVGRWSMDMILLYTLKKPDIFPADDFHLKQMMTQLYGLSSTKLKTQMKNMAAHWSPYRSFGIRYLLEWKTYLKTQPL